MLLRQGDRLLQIGVALFLLTSFEGFVIPSLAAPRLGLSAHSLMALLGVLLIAMGLLWPKLLLGVATSRLAFWTLVYSSLAIVAAYLLGAIWGAGNFTMPLACGHCSRKRVSGNHHQNRGVLIRADRNCFFRPDSLGPSHWRSAIKRQLDSSSSHLAAARRISGNAPVPYL